ncbi:MAG: ATP-binding protein [Betaproteobacteria bacterium]
MPAFLYTLFARTFLLAVALVLLTTATWLVVFQLSEAEPRAREAADLTASAANLVRAALIASAPEKRPELFSELGAREGIRLLPAEDSDQLQPLPDRRYYRLLREEIMYRLGPKTRLAQAVNGVPGFWVTFRLDDQDDEEYWVILPMDRTHIALGWEWLAWGGMALGLALLVAWLIASRLSRPLAVIAQAASVVGRGQTPAPLPEVGAEEMRQVAAAFNRMAVDLKRHEHDRAEVLAGISHDLRTPLTRLRLEAEMSVADETSRAEIVADIAQMESVIAQFLDYARGEQGEAATPANPTAMLEEIAARENRPGRDLSARIAPLPACLLRQRALRRAVTNLVDNAFKYGSLEVELNASAENGILMIEVCDRGPGIPPGDTERVKRPFTRLDEARGGATGTGLGLAIVERIARLHDGKFNLLPRPGGGLIARLELPIRRV